MEGDWLARPSALGAAPHPDLPLTKGPPVATLIRDNSGMEAEVHEGSTGTQARSGGSWSNLFIMFAMVMGGWVSVLWVSDTDHPAWLALLIGQSIMFGMAMARLPPVRAWHDRRDRAGR